MPKLTTHPALMPRRMTCKKINHITHSDHGTFLVEYETIPTTCGVTNQPIPSKVRTLDCASLLETRVYRPTPECDEIIFGFTEYVTEEERARLHAAFERGEYDYLGNLPEF